MTRINARAVREQARHCRERAMRTTDSEIEELFLQTAEDLEGQAIRLKARKKQGTNGALARLH